jgi:hypothetical protein
MNSQGQPHREGDLIDFHGNFLVNENNEEQAKEEREQPEEVPVAAASTPGGGTFGEDFGKNFRWKEKKITKKAKEESVVTASVDSGWTAGESVVGNPATEETATEGSTAGASTNVDSKSDLK